ncbi:MAG: DNA mismatch repair endonuclease MutL [Bacteroidia bacterium]
MQHLIQLLPDAIANQIAAGEVVQRPASVIKELLENAIDAGATKVEVELKNAGKTLIRVSDNGCGMSAQDARMCFERHATSKIKNQKDLFAIRTLGFRGEALASIAAVAQVRLRTRLHDAELGTETQIEASTFEAQQAVVCPPGTMFEIKNLFFNVPARRNFLKSNPVETRHILNEFVRISLAHPEVHLSLIHNETSVYQLSQTEQEERIAQLFGTELRGKMREIEETTGYVRIGGFIGLPEIYRKNRSEQFFFVNGRYIRSNYLNHAVYTAFEAFLPRDRYPFYVIFLEIDPVHVDINIHPTKTEVKFDDEQTIYALLHSVVKRALGTIENAPEFDFTDADLKAAIYGSQPARSPGAEPSIGKKQSFQLPQQKTVSPKDWDHLYKGESRPAKTDSETARKQEDLFGQKAQAKAEHVKEDTLLVQHQLRYIITQKGPDLLVIDQHLAHQRILYESFLRSREGGKLASQQLLFPQTMEFSAADYQLLMTAVDIFAKLGFEVKEFGKNTLIVYGVPTEIATSKVKTIFAQILDDLKQMGQTKVESKIFEGIAKAVSYRSAVTSPHKLSSIEMKNMVNALFRCEAPGFAPNGRPTFKVLSMQELEQFFR